MMWVCRRRVQRERTIAPCERETADGVFYIGGSLLGFSPILLQA